jgi:hypothetical protein
MSSWSGGSSFTDLPSWQDSFNTKLPSSLTSSSGGFSKMLGPIAGIASAGASIFSGILGNQAAKDSLRMQNLMQNAALLEGREQNKGQLAGSLFNQIFGTGTGADISFGREKAAKEFLVGPYAERVMGLERQSAKDARIAAISPEAKELAQFNNRLAIQRSLAEQRAKTDAMFGPTSSSYRA